MEHILILPAGLTGYPFRFDFAVVQHTYSLVLMVVGKDSSEKQKNLIKITGNGKAFGKILYL